MGTPATIASGLASSTLSGNSGQYHLVYASHSAVWWVFWCDGSTNTTVHAAHSSDLSTWTAATALTLTYPLAGSGDGRNLGVACVTNGTTDVVHVACACANGTQPVLYDVRATVTATSITWGTPNSIPCATTRLSTPDGTAPSVASDGGVFVNSGWPDSGTHAGNAIVSYNATADTGATWTPGTWTSTEIEIASQTVLTRASVPLTSGNILALWDNANGPPATGVRYAVMGRTGGTPTAANVVTSLTGWGTSNDEWGVCARSTSDVHLVAASGSAGAYVHYRFNGTSWSAGDSIPTFGRVAGSGLALLSDGTHVWLFAISSVTGNAISYSQWTSGSGWSAWTSFVSTSATRTYIAPAQGVAASTAAVIWTEGTSTYSLMVAGLSTSSGGTVINGSATLDGEGVLAVPRAAIDAHATAAASSVLAAPSATIEASATIDGESALNTDAAAVIFGSVRMAASSGLLAAQGNVLGKATLAGERVLSAPSATVMGSAPLVSAAKLDALSAHVWATVSLIAQGILMANGTVPSESQPGVLTTTIGVGGSLRASVGAVSSLTANVAG